MTKQIQLDDVLQIFMRICEIYRPSGDEGDMRSFLLEWADSHGFDHAQDSKGNISIRTKSGKPSIALQAHMDMVLVFENGKPATKDVFMGIKTEQKDGVLRSVGSSLGSDNGMAIAYMMIIAEQYVDLNVELIFTVDEERGLVGASAIDPDIILSDTLLNLDNEMNHEICMATCGISHCRGNFSAPNASSIDHGTSLEVELSGLHGGHSGCDIAGGYGNAILQLIELIVTYTGELRVLTFSGGVADNAIPTKAVASIIVDNDVLFQEHISSQRSSLVERFHIGEITSKQYQTSYGECYDWLPLLENIFHQKDGVHMWADADKKEPKTSSNLAFLNIKNATADILYSVRSSLTDDMMDTLMQIENNLGKPMDKKILTHGWEADPECIFIGQIQASMSKVSDQVYRSSIHASLEAGIIQSRKPSLKVASIGPMIHHPHSIHECIYLDDIELYCQYLSMIMDDISETHSC